MRCPSCGASIQPNQRFCMDCGATLRSSPVDPTIPIRVLGGSDEATPPSGSPGAAAPADPTIRLNIVEQTTARPTSPGWFPTDNEPTQVWAPAPTLAATPITAAAATFVDANGRSVGEQVVERRLDVGEGWRTAPLRPVADRFDAAPLAIFAVVAVVLGLVAVLTKVVTFAFGNGTAGSFAFTEVSTNAVPAMVVVVAAMLVGTGMAIARQRFGAGLAGGAGLALAGLAAIEIAVAGQRIDALQRLAEAGGGLTLTREAPYFVMIATGAGGIMVFVASLTAAGRDGRPPLNAVACSVGALAVLAIAVGPFIPGNSTSWSTNVDSAVFPTVAVWLRFVALGLVAAAGVIGFVNMRRWGTGVVIGSLVAVFVQWLGTMTSTADPDRTGVGIDSIGTTDSAPHLAITIGIIVALVAAVLCVLVGVSETLE